MGNYDYANESLTDTLRNNKKITIGLLAFIIGVLLFQFVLVPRLFGGATSTAKDVSQLINAKDIIRGNKDSKVTVILFEDPQCPACQNLSKTEGEKLEKYYDKVRFVYKYVRAVSGHTFAREAISYIYAAEAISGKGYELAEKAYKTSPDVQKLTKTEFLGYANDIGINNTDMVTKSSAKEVTDLAAQQEEDFSFRYPSIEGYSKDIMRITGTPGTAIIIDGKLVRVSTGQDRSALIDQTKDFNANMVSSYLEKYFNPNATSTESAPSVETIPVTPAPTPAPAQ